jgi:hypothetical protein
LAGGGSAAGPHAEKKTDLNFAYTPVRIRETADGRRFQIGRLSADGATGPRDLTHLLDAAYDYASPRELRWYLAERFALPVDLVQLTRH